MPEEVKAPADEVGKVELHVDSPPPDGVEATSTRDWWKRPIRVDARGALACAAKAITNLAIGNVPGAAWEAVDGALKFKATKEPEELAGQLITRAVWGAVVELVGAVREALNHQDVDALLQLASDASDDALAFETRIDISFFENPQASMDLGPIQQVVERFMMAGGVAPTSAKHVAARLPAYVTLALHEEWGRRPDVYDGLLARMETRFLQASRDERAWMAYRAELMRLPDEPLMGEPITLGQIFVPLRCWRWETIENKEARNKQSPLAQPEKRRRRTVEKVEETIHCWLDSEDYSDAVRAISGGPGAGKSSLSKMIATDRAKAGKKVILIPLKKLDHGAQLEDSLAEFCRNQGHLLEDAFRDKKLLLILDGLDELSMLGESAAEEAKEFVEAVTLWVGKRNQAGGKVRVLFTGRTVVVTALGQLKRAEAVRELLPLLVPKRDELPGEEARAAGALTRESFHDPQNLLDADDREVWWRRYADAVTDAPDPAPLLARPDLRDLTQEPLLNFLIALSGQTVADLKGASSRAVLYDKLVRSVYRRRWGRDRAAPGDASHPVLGDLEEQEFVELLEEFAIPVWHGGGGVATLKALEKRCRDADVTDLLEKLRGGLDKGVPQLLAAFYFRPAGHGVGENTYEFTHKSFWEYLVARRITRLASEVAQERAIHEDKRNRAKGWRIEDALPHWGDLCGPVRMEQNLFRFVHEEVTRRAALAPAADDWQSDRLDAPAVQKHLAALFEHVVNDGMPPQPTWSSQSSMEILSWFRHASESLLATHHALAVTVRERSQIHLATPNRLGHWLAAARGQRTGQFLPGLASIGWLSVNVGEGHRVNLLNQDLQGGDLGGVGLQLAILQRADLQDAILQDANLQDAKLQGAILRGADLRVAKLQGAILRGANLQDAKNVDQAHWDGAIINAKTINPPPESEWERLPAPDIGPDCFRLQRRSPAKSSPQQHG